MGVSLTYCDDDDYDDGDELILLDAGPPLLCDGVCQWGRPHVPGWSELIEFHRRYKRREKFSRKIV